MSGEVATAAVFDERGERVENVRGEQVEQTLDPGTYQFSLSEGMKLYLHAEAPEGVTIVRPDADQGRLEFGTNIRLTIGARSHHERPAGVVTTTEDSADAIDAERYTVIGDDDFGVVNSNNPGVDAVASADEESLVHTYHPASIRAPNLATRWVETGVEPDVDVDGGLFLDPDVDHRCPHDTDDYFDHISGDSASIWIDGDLSRLDELTDEDLYTR